LPNQRLLRLYVFLRNFAHEVGNAVRWYTKVAEVQKAGSFAEPEIGNSCAVGDELRSA
jgi:hypothetical protein